EAVTWAAFPGSTTRSASEARLWATPLAPLVEALNSVAFRTPGAPTVSKSADWNPPLGGSSPVSDTVVGPTPSVGTLTKAAKARPLYVTPACAGETAPRPLGGLAWAGEAPAMPKMSSRHA